LAALAEVEVDVLQPVIMAVVVEAQEVVALEVPLDALVLVRWVELYLDTKTMLGVAAVLVVHQ
jgi:hypothetical protein